jgi:hypothetical protein
MLRRLLILSVMAAIPIACSSGSGCDAGVSANVCARVLFIGNSYTSVNGLPETFAKLAASSGRHVDAAMLADGGATLANHVASPATAAKFGSATWDVVVLQEQSQIPSISQSRRQTMYPAARQLVRLARDAGAQPVLFETWGRRDGRPENGLATYDDMQSAIDDGYRTIAGEESVAVAFVGTAWRRVVQEESQRDLWQADGSHPTMKGTYLAACVIYATIFGSSPRGLSYRAGLPATEAAYLQSVAADTVLGASASATPATRN